MRKQTAVEFLVKKMLNQDWYTYKSLEYIKQAKEMEKQEKLEAFVEGYKQKSKASNLIFDEASRMCAIILFTETFKD